MKSPSGDSPLALRSSLVRAAIPAHSGAACEVPPPTTTCCRKTNLTPVNGSATAATSGTSRRSAGPASGLTICHDGLPNNWEAPPALPWVKGTSYHDCSPSQPPSASVDSVVPPTAVISGTEATASTPTSSGVGGSDQFLPPRHSRPARSPVASKAVVPRRSAAASAERTGARSAAVISRSHPQPIEKLQIAPGNWRSTDSISRPSFS